MRPAGVKQLTARQREVLKLAAAGATYKEIARQLGVTSKTARNHLTNVYGQLEVHTRAEATIHALRLGLVDLSDRPRRPAQNRMELATNVFDGLNEADASSTSSPVDPTIAKLKRPVPRRQQEE